MTTKQVTAAPETFNEDQALAYAEMAITLPDAFATISAGFSEENTKRVNAAIVVKNAAMFATTLEKKLLPENKRDERFSANLQSLAEMVPALAEILPTVIKTDLKPVQGQGTGNKNVTDFAFEIRPNHKLLVRLTRPEVL